MHTLDKTLNFSTNCVVFVREVVAVLFPPSLIHGPPATTEYITDNVGDKVTLNCSATGSPSLAYVFVVGRVGAVTSLGLVSPGAVRPSTPPPVTPLGRLA